MVARRARGFTLVEMMIVVAIVGILAVLATVGYSKWVRSAHMAEATDMLGDIRKAEESFRAENGAYLKVSNSLSSPDLYPAPTPGKFVTRWGVPCSTCLVPWSRLNVQPTVPVYFGYAVVADPSAAPSSAGVSVIVNGANVDLSSLQGSPWYVAVARGDIDGNGVFCSVFATSSSNQLAVDQEGE